MLLIIKHYIYFLGVPTQEENTTADFSTETVDSAFSIFVDEIFDVLKKEDFRKVRRKCLENLNVTAGISLSTDDKNRIANADDLYDLFDVTCSFKAYWNWMNIRVIEKMAGRSPKAKKLIEQYKNEVFSRKIKDVMLEISNLEVPTDIDKYTEVTEKLNKEFDELRIKDVVKRWREIEKLFEAEGTMVLKHIVTGCVEICWLLPNDLAEHAVCLANSIPLDKNTDQSTTDNQEVFSESLFFKVGDVIIKDAVTSKMGNSIITDTVAST